MKPPTTHWLILGNNNEHQGCKRTSHSVGNGSKLIVFNNRKVDVDLNTLRIYNNKNSLSPHFDTKGDLPYVGFDEDLYQTALELETYLNNWPSIGLTTLVTLSRASIPFDIQGMNLFPGIARQNQTDVAHPLPCYFHNWLGERRVALDVLSESEYHHVICKLKLERPGHHFDSSAASEDPFSLLDKLQSGQFNLHLIQDLASIDVSVWSNNSTYQKLHHAEQYFHLPRTKAHTMHWWLFNYQASRHMDHVRSVLGYCQQLPILGRA